MKAVQTTRATAHFSGRIRLIVNANRQFAVDGKS
jgi:hypothetical protein